MRAPPDDDSTMSGRRLRAAYSQARANFSPTTAPIDPPMYEKSMIAATAGMWRISSSAHTMASPSPVLPSASVMRST